MVKYLLFILAVILMNLSCSDDCEFSSIKSSALPNAKIGKVYSYKIELETSCTPARRTITHTDGDMPDGISIDESGTFSGTPTKAGTFNFTLSVRVCFAAGATDFTDCHDKTKEFSLIVEE